MSPADRSPTYREAGVDIEAGDALVEAIKPVAAATRRDGVVDGLGGFGALFEIPGKFRKPLLVSGTDGVGTKLKLAFELNRHESVGIDLVAMCANDVVVQGAEPLFFLDYFATGRLSHEVALKVIRGIGTGCELAGAALIGGETAEMPGLYAPEEYDLAGFCVGAVEKDAVIDGSGVRPGDAVVGLAASGPHSNGYSLIRRIVESKSLDLAALLEDETVGDHLMRPTRIYVKPVLELIRSVEVRSIAHITGGGIAANVSRVLPSDVSVELHRSAWPRLPVLDWIQDLGGIEDAEMLKTFNCGVGMIIVVPATAQAAALEHFRAAGIEAFEVGRVKPRDGEAVQIHD